MVFNINITQYYQFYSLLLIQYYTIFSILKTVLFQFNMSRYSSILQAISNIRQYSSIFSQASCRCTVIQSDSLNISWRASWAAPEGTAAKISSRAPRNKQQYLRCRKEKEKNKSLPLLPGGHPAGTSPSPTSKVLLFIPLPLGRSGLYPGDRALGCGPGGTLPSGHAKRNSSGCHLQCRSGPLPLPARRHGPPDRSSSRGRRALRLA